MFLMGEKNRGTKEQRRRTEEWIFWCQMQLPTGVLWQAGTDEKTTWMAGAQAKCRQYIQGRLMDYRQRSWKLARRLGARTLSMWQEGQMALTREVKRSASLLQ